MALVRPDLISTRVRRLIRTLPKETTVAVNEVVVRVGGRRLYDTSAYCTTANRMRLDLNSELVEYLIERMARVNNNAKKPGWTLITDKREALSFSREDFNFGFEEYQKVLFCPSGNSVDLMDSYWMVRDYHNRQGDIVAHAFVKDNGYVVIHAKDDKKPSRSGLSSTQRVLENLLLLLKTYRRERKDVET